MGLATESQCCRMFSKWLSVLTLTHFFSFCCSVLFFGVFVFLMFLCFVLFFNNYSTTWQEVRENQLKDSRFYSRRWSLMFYPSMWCAPSGYNIQNWLPPGVSHLCINGVWTDETLTVLGSFSEPWDNDLSWIRDFCCVSCFHIWKQ